MKSIYHYTSLETLAILLQDKTIAFKKLTTLDDPWEKYIKLSDELKQFYKSPGGKINLGGYCFVSCWSYQEEESIAMWDMYGDRKQGVRIELPNNLLDKNYDIYKNRHVTNVRSLFERTVKKECPQLIDIIYEENAMGIKDSLLDALGRYKIPEWEFQKECRFRLYAMKTTNDEECYYCDDKINHSIVNLGPLTTDTLLWGISEESLSQIKIIVGPEMSKGKEALLAALAEKYKIHPEQIMKSKFSVV